MRADAALNTGWRRGWRVLRVGLVLVAVGVFGGNLIRCLSVRPADGAQQAELPAVAKAEADAEASEKDAPGAHPPGEDAVKK